MTPEDQEELRALQELERRFFAPRKKKRLLLGDIVAMLLGALASLGGILLKMEELPFCEPGLLQGNPICPLVAAVVTIVLVPIGIALAWLLGRGLRWMFRRSHPPARHG